MIAKPISNPKVALLASLIVGALASAAFVLRPGDTPLPTYQSGYAGRDVATSRTLETTPPAGTQASGRVLPKGGTNADAAVADVLDAVRSTLKRNDLASAKLLLLSVEQTLNKDDVRVQALQRELDAREHAMAQSAPLTVANEDRPQKTWATNRTTTRSWTHSEHARHARNGSAPQGSAVANSTTTGSTARNAASAYSATNSPTNSSATPELSSPPVTAPANDATSLRPAIPEASVPTAPQTVVQAPRLEVQNTPAPQTVQPQEWTPSASQQGPKSRQQVRAELEHARADGALPRFGNPDPAGPGGAPSRTVDPVPVSW